MLLLLAPLLLLCYVIKLFVYKLVRVVNDGKKGLRHIKSYEKMNNCRVVYLLDKDEKIKYFDLENYLIGNKVSLDIDGSEMFRDILESCINKAMDVVLVIDCSGGSVVDSDYIVKHIDIFRSYGRKITAIVPRKAYSAACLIAFACDEIQMGKLSSLTPIDPISYDDEESPCSIASLKHAFDDLDKIAQPTGMELAQHFDDLKLYDETKKNMKLYVKRRMKKNTDNKNADNKNLELVLKSFTSGKLSHHTLFSVKDLTNMGLHIKKINDQYKKILVEYYIVIYRMMEMSY